MKKWMKGVSTILPGVLFLFAGYVVPQAVADETTVEFVFPPEDVSFQASDDGMSVQLREGTMPEDMPGTPWLPVRYVTIAVPSGAQIQRIDVQGEEILLRRDIDVIPVQPPQPLSQPRTARVPKDAAAYARADRIPVTQAVLTGTHTLRGYSLATVRLNPLRYVPAARELYLAPRLTVSVVYDAPKAALRAPTRHADSVRKLVQSLVVNPDALNAEPDLSATDELLLPDGAVDYLIITTGALTNAFQTLADHRAQFSGLSTRVMSVEEIAATYAGTDLQMQIRNCISNHYASMGTLYVVLGGDDTVVPDRDCYVECGPYVESQMPTDLYYSGLDGTWNADGDVIYGETSDNVDLGWDVIVGRIPVRTADQAAGYINKLMSCETNVPVELTHKILLGGALLWDSYTGTNRPSDNVTGDGHWGFLDAAHPVVSDSEMWSRRLYRDGIYPYWIPETVGIFSDTLTSWDTASGGDYLQNAANLRSKFNLGWYHTFFGTHGNVTVWGLESGTFSSSDAAALTNATMIVYTMACITGAFDNSSDPCLSEAFLRNPNGGALAYIGCSRYGWGSPDVPPASNSSDGGPSMQYGYRFYRRLYETNDVSVGMAFATHKADMAGSSGANGAYRWIQFGLNFQGDPAFGLPSQAQNLLKVTPFSALGITGYQGGPFTPSNIVYTLSNTSTSNLSWTAGCTSTWVTVSPAGGILAAGQISLVTVSINANANSLGAGTKTGVIVFSNVTSHTSSSRIVQLVVRPRVLDHFAWDPVESAQYVGQSIPVRIQAADATDSLLASFTNRVGLSGWVGPVVTATNVLIGSGINSWSYPMNTYWHDSRTQVIYLTNEVGTACTINSLALNVTTVPGQVMNNWTIRMKHTSLAGYGASPVWETGWTTVFQTNEPVGTTGWRTFVFSTPFTYNGTNNLLIDFSHNNSSYTTEGYCQYTAVGQNRVIYYCTDSGYGDPLGWPINGNPTRNIGNSIPNLRLGVSGGTVVTITPTNSGNFVGGVWTGSVIVLEPATNLYLRADDGSGHLGMTEVFTVLPGPLLVQPLDGLSSTGYQGGPFTPSNTVYTLSNTGASSLSWTAGCTSTWVTVSPAGGTLLAGRTKLVTVSINTNVNSLGAGTNTGGIIFSNVTVSGGQLRTVQLVVQPRVLDHFAWDAFSPAQYVGLSVPVRIQAMDATDCLLATFTNRVGLSGFGTAGTNILFGSGTNTWELPMFTEWHDSRTQVIYLANELGTACSINALALNVMTVPGRAMNKWTIRMKHTSLANYGASPVWETGWTTVIQTNEPVGTTGWRTFAFSTPFSYNGTSNLLIDFSYNNSSYGNSGRCQCTTGSQNRAIYYHTDSGEGDPLGWPTNGYNPTPGVSVNRPNLRLGGSIYGGVAVTITPTNSGGFVSGVWTGAVTVLQAASNMYLRAVDGSGHTGNSNPFNVFALAGDTDGDGIPDWWEQQYYGGATNANPNTVCSNGINTVRQAYIAGLNPTDPQSQLLISDFQALTAGKVLGWNAVSGRVYSVYWTSNLLNSFQCLESNIPWTRGSFTNQTSVPCGYYKLGVQLE